jgi:predicted permease
LRPGVSNQQVLAELNTTLGKDRDISPLVLLSHFHWEVRSASTGLEGRRAFYREPLQILMAAVALILLLACANLANLLLSKAASRHREIAVRLAVGAGRGRVIRQLLTEAFLISIPAGALGVLLAYGFSETLLTYLSNGGPRLLLDVTPDSRVLVFALAVSIMACVLFGLAPAILSTRWSLQPLLAETPGTRSRLGKALLVTQMAISVILLIVGGIFVRTLVNLYQVDTGLNPSDVILFSSNLTSFGYAGLGYSTGRVQREETALLSELATVQGIEAVTFAKYPPISRGSWSQPLLVEGHEVDPIEPHLNSVAPDFFKTFGTTLLVGREFDNGDTDDAPRVVVVNEAFARSVFSDGSPLGKWVAFPFEKEAHYQIVGVVKDVRYENLRDEPPKTVYFAAAQVPPGDSTIFAVRTRTSIAAISPAIQQVLTKVDPILRAQDMHTLRDHIARSVFQERMLAILSGFFGALTLVLAAVGIYGVMAYNVSRRKREIGIRIALGANRGSVIRLILGQTIALTLLGSTIGTLASFGLTRSAAGFLFGIRPNDPATIAAAFAILLGVAVAAAYLPGRRAARTNPVETLRFE